MKINDKDVGVCGKQAKADYSSKISNQLRGEAGTSFTLTVKRPMHEKLLRFRLKRQVIKQPSVPFARLLPNHVGYVVMTGYRDDTTHDLRQAIEQLKAKGAQRLVLDLRGNGGGLMNEAVQVVNLFIPKGKKVLDTGMTQEIDRCRAALEEAAAGENVVVISSGDAGIYGMAGLVLELLMKMDEEQP